MNWMIYYHIHISSIRYVLFFLDENTSKTTTFFIDEKTHSLLRQNHFPYSQNFLNLWFHSIACSSIPFLLLLNRSIVLLNIFFHSLWESATPFLSGKTLIRCTFKIIAADTFHVIPKAKTNFKFWDFICARNHCQLHFDTKRHIF